MLLDVCLVIITRQTPKSIIPPYLNPGKMGTSTIIVEVPILPGFKFPFIHNSFSVNSLY